MTIRGLAGLAMAVAAAVGTAHTASAAEPMEGIYSYNEPGREQATWTIYDTCVPAGCTLHVGGVTPHKGFESDDPPYEGDARPVNGIWTLPVNKVDGFRCADGSTAPSVDIYKFDDATLTGTHTVTHGAVCGLQPGLTNTPFTLAYQGPIPFPVEQNPLICDFARQCF